MELNFFIYCVAFILLALGLFYLAQATILGEPFKPSGTKLIKTVYEEPTKNRDLWLLHPFCDVLNFVARFVFLQPGEELSINNKLMRIGLNYNAKQYIARGYCGILVGILFMLLSYTVGFSMGVIFGIGISVYLYMRNRDLVYDQIGEMNRMARQELPQFVRAIENSVETERDMVRIIKRYMNIAGPGLRRDLDILLLDMNTGNVQVAFQNFDTRIGLPEVSQLVSILINIDRGIDQGAALTNLAANLSLLAREQNRRELALRPGKMYRAMLPAAIIAVAAMFYVFIVSVVNNVSNIYG